MKLELSLLLAFALAAAGLGAAEPVFDAPSGLTLQARDAGRYQLLWDPIYRDDLLGYSVWLRRPGEKEFTRLSVPVKVGKEVRKMPVTSEARLVLALGASRKDVEVSVLAEYEDGVSERAPSAFTRLAARPAAPLVDGTPLSPTAKAEPTPEATPDAAVAASQDEGRGFDRPLPDQNAALVTPFGRWRSEVGLEFDFKRSIRQGKGEFWTLGLLGTGIPWEQVVDWERIDTRSIFSVPLTLRFGLMPGFEAWARARYSAEDVHTGAYIIDGYNFDFITPIRIVDGEIIELPDPSSAGIGDAQAGVRIQPFEKVPLVLGAGASIPTGYSRFRAYLDWNSGRKFPAGLGQGVSRMDFSAEWGRATRARGLAFRAAYSPGVSERVRAPFFDVEYDQRLDHGDRFEVGGSFTQPWRLRGLNGSIAPGITFRSISPSRWVIDGTDMYPLFSPIQQSRIVAHMDTRFVRDDQLELSVEALQDLPSGFRAGGRVSYVAGVQGDALRLSGQFYY